MRMCGKRCWWAKGDPYKCTCKCLGAQHGILRVENKERFDRWAEEEAEVWRRREYIRKIEAKEVEI